MWCVFRTRSFSMQCIYHSLELSSSSIRDTAPVQTSPGCSQLRDGMYRRSRSELPFSDPRWPPDSETSSENPNFVSQLTFVRPLAPSTTSIALRIRVAPPSGETCHLVRRGSWRISRPFWALVSSSSINAEIRSDIADEATVSEAILPELESQTHQVRLQSHLQVGVCVTILVLGRRRCMGPAMPEHPA